MVYDLAALEHDSTMNNNRKFNTMRDHVNTIKNEISYFSNVIFSAQKSRPDIQEIIRSYTETLKGLWNRVNREISSAEQVMIQVLRTAKFDANSQYSAGGEIKPEDLKAAHLREKALVDELYDFVLLLDENILLYRLGTIGQTTLSLAAKHKAILEDKNVLKCFSRIVTGFEKEFDFNENVFQDFAGDLIETMNKFCSLYGGLELTNYKQHLLQYTNADSQTIIRNMIINPLQEYAEFIDSSLFKKTMKAAEKYNPKIMDRLTILGQNYFEYNKCLIDMANFTMKLGVARTDAERAQLIQAIEKLVKFRADKFYKEVDMVLVDAIKQAFPYQIQQPTDSNLGYGTSAFGNATPIGTGSILAQPNGQNQYDGTNGQMTNGNYATSQFGGQSQFGQPQQPTQGGQAGGYNGGANTYNQSQFGNGQGGANQGFNSGFNGNTNSQLAGSNYYENQGQPGQSSFGQPQQGNPAGFNQPYNSGQNQHKGQFEGGFEPFGQSTLGYGGQPTGGNIQGQSGGNYQTGQNGGVQGQNGGYWGQQGN